jgi:hypothetical protein
MARPEKREAGGLYGEKKLEKKRKEKVLAGCWAKTS